jgi:chaperonin GroEL
MPKNIHYGSIARQDLANGINILANPVKATLGPKGRNAVLGRPYGSQVITKDGVTVAREISVANPFENAGVELVKEVASKTNDDVGDGTTTATILAQAIVNQSLNNIRQDYSNLPNSWKKFFSFFNRGVNPIALKRGIDTCVEAIVKELKDNISKPVKDEEIADVAAISANDKDIGIKIAEAIMEVGHDGIITVEESQSYGMEIETVHGMRFDKGCISPYMITNTDRMEAEYVDPYILIYDKKISAVQEIIPLLEKVAQTGKKELVIIAEDVDGEALSTLVLNKMRGIFSVLAIKAPSFGDNRREMLIDIATVTGGKVVSAELGMKLETTNISDLGKARKVVATKDFTTIIKGNSDETILKSRIEHVKSQILLHNDIIKTKLEERLAKLIGGIAIIKVGAATETEMREIKHRIEDAIGSTKAALAEGVVPGGGVALIRASKALDSLVFADSDEAAAVDIIRKALEEPAFMLASNAGKNGKHIVKEIKDLEGNMGYNAATDTYEDMVAAGIIDPTKVTRSALQNAASIASLVLTTEAVIVEIPRPVIEMPTPRQPMY